MFSNVSLVIYIVHLLIYNIIKNYSKEIQLFSLITENEYLLPLTVIALSFMCGVIYDIALNAKKIKNRCR